MINEEECREVAERLRALDVHEWYDSADEVDSLETAIGCSIGQDWQDQAWWERLADLIERPTCHNASGHQDACAKARDLPRDRLRRRVGGRVGVAGNSLYRQSRRGRMREGAQRAREPHGCLLGLLRHPREGNPARGFRIQPTMHMQRGGGACGALTLMN